MLVPASLALVVEAFPAERRAHAIGLWGATAAVAAGVGPPIGGALVELGGWRWAFLVNLPFGLVAVWAARHQLVESRAPGRRTHARPASAPRCWSPAWRCSTSASSRAATGVGRSPRWSVSFVGAAVLLVLFVLSSRRHRSPLLDPALLRIRSFTLGSAATVVAGFGFYAYLLTNILWLQYVWGYDVLRGRSRPGAGRARRRASWPRGSARWPTLRLPRLRRARRARLGRRLPLVPPAGRARARLLGASGCRARCSAASASARRCRCSAAPRWPPSPGAATPPRPPWCRAPASSAACSGSPCSW